MTGIKGRAAKKKAQQGDKKKEVMSEVPDWTGESGKRRQDAPDWISQGG